MTLDQPIRVLVIDDDSTTSQSLARYLGERRYEVQTCADLAEANEVLTHWRPHVLVLVPTLEAERHGELGALRRLHPRVPVVLLTVADGQDLLLDVEAYAPTLPARPSRGLRHIESAVAAASASC